MLYEAFAHDQPSPLPELPIQYADYAAWQRRWLAGEALEDHLTYWRRQLRGSPPLLPLPTDRPRPPRQSFRGAYAEFALPGRASPTPSAASAARNRSTPFMTLLAAFSVMLQRLTGLDDLPIGTGVANRTHVETEGLVGCFLNMLVLRLNLSGAPTFRTLLTRVREMTVEAYAHSDVPFENRSKPSNPNAP